MAVIRPPLPQDGYFIADREWFRDPRLSYKAKGILGHILSHNSNYVLTTKQLIAESTDGRDSVLAGLRELVAVGYLARTRRRVDTDPAEEANDGEDGKPRQPGSFDGFDYQVTQPPPFDPKADRTTTNGKSSAGSDQGKRGTTNGKPASGKPASGLAASGKPATKRDNPKRDQGLGDPDLSSKRAAADPDLQQILDAEPDATRDEAAAVVVRILAAQRKPIRSVGGLIRTVINAGEVPGLLRQVRDDDQRAAAEVAAAAKRAELRCEHDPSGRLVLPGTDEPRCPRCRLAGVTAVAA